MGEEEGRGEGGQGEGADSIQTDRQTSRLIERVSSNSGKKIKLHISFLFLWYVMQGKPDISLN